MSRYEYPYCYMDTLQPKCTVWIFTSYCNWTLHTIYSDTACFSTIYCSATCDWILEKQSKSHIRSFEINGFDDFKSE